MEGENNFTKPNENNESVESLPGEWIDLSDKRIVLREDEVSIHTGDMTIEAGQGQSIIGKYNHFHGTMMVAGPGGNLYVTPHTPEKEQALTDAGYAKATIAVPNLLGHQKFEDDGLQAQFEAM